MSGWVKSEISALPGALCALSLPVLPCDTGDGKCGSIPVSSWQAEQGDLQGDRQGWNKPQCREGTNRADPRHPGRACRSKNNEKPNLETEQFHGKNCQVCSCRFPGHPAGSFSEGSEEAEGRVFVHSFCASSVLCSVALSGR